MKRGEILPVTVKQLAKQWHVTRQAIRARITRTKDFKKKYTHMEHNVRIISDDGVNILKKHGNNTHKHFNVEDKRLLEMKIKYLTDLNKDLEHNNPSKYIKRLENENNRLSSEVKSLHQSNKRQQELTLAQSKNISELKYILNNINAQLSYYRDNNWFERLFKKKPTLPHNKKTIMPVTTKHDK